MDIPYMKLDISNISELLFYGCYALANWDAQVENAKCRNLIVKILLLNYK